MTIIGAWALIKWDDEDEPKERYISFGEEVLNEYEEVVSDTYGFADDNIFFYGELNDEQDYRNGVHGWVMVDWELNDTTPFHNYRWHKVIFKFNDYMMEISQLVNAPNIQVAISEARSMLRSNGFDTANADLVIGGIADDREYED